MCFRECLNKLPFKQGYESVRKELKAGSDPRTLIETKQKEVQEILNWFQGVDEWGQESANKYRELYLSTRDEKYMDLQFQAIATMSAPWALSWLQFNIGECYEFLQEYEAALEEYKKSFTLWVEVKGWNGNGAQVDSFKRSLIILSKLKNRNKFMEFRKWLFGNLKKCPSAYQRHYRGFVIEDLNRREARVGEKFLLQIEKIRLA
jgi:tetratricopeptide (TPR) repeat protein